MRLVKSWHILAASAAIALVGAVVLAHKPARGQATTTVQLPVATVTSVTTGAAVQIAPANPGRRTLSICVGSAAGGITVLPGTATTVTTANGIFIASSTCLNPPTNAVQSGTAIGGGNSWQAIAVSNTTLVSFIEW